MPQGRPTNNAVNKEALNALTDLYYLYGEMAAHVLKSDESPEQLDIFYVRPGGLKQLLHKYYELASPDPEEAGSNVHALTLERLLPTGTLSQTTEESWNQIQAARGDLKKYNNAKQGYGSPTPQGVREVLDRGYEILHRRQQQNGSGIESSQKPKVVITASGIGIPGVAGQHYSLRGGRKVAILKLFETHPHPLSAKAWTRLIDRSGTVSSDFAQKVSADVNDINKRFMKNLELEHKLVINRGGYLLNFEELDISHEV